MISIPDAIQFQPHHAELVFDDETHIYRLKGGEILSSVTSILKAEGIQQYGPRNADADFKMQVGTWVHQAIAWFEHGTLDESTLSDGIRPYLDSYKLFKKATGFEAILPLIEVPMWHPNWRFCGTPDLPGRIGNRFILTDLKTGGKRSGDSVQIPAYGDLVRASVVGFENIYPEGIVVYLQDDGRMAKCEPVSAADMHEYSLTFYAALQVNRWKKAHNQANE
jgi:hypothetical protein